MSQRRLAWNRALCAMRHDRLTLPEIREDRLRSTAGLRGAPYIALSAWRGRSGRRYIVGVHGLDVLAAPAAGVAIGVRRGADGIAAIVAVGTHHAFAEHAVGLSESGVTEIHLHRLAADEAEERAVMLDLRAPPAMPPMAHQAPRPLPIVTVG